MSSLPAEDKAVKEYVEEEVDVDDYSDVGLIRVFGIYMSETTRDVEAAPSPEALAIRTARDFRDLIGVNILRVLDRCGYQHPDGYLFRFDFSDREESFFRRFDPVTPGERAPGGSADFRPGDVFVIEEGWAVVIATDNHHLLALTPGGLGLYPLAVIRNLFELSDYEVRLVDGGRVIRHNGGDQR